MNTTAQLDDHIADVKVDVTYPGLSNQDVLDFCAYFRVSFYSLRVLSALPDGVPATDYFRVATNDVPARGMDVTFHSVVSWKAARSRMVADLAANAEFDTPFAGRVTVLAVAESIETGGTPVVVLQLADGAMRYVSKDKFLGMSYDRTTDEYIPNSMPVDSAHVRA